MVNGTLNILFPDKYLLLFAYWCCLLITFAKNLGPDQAQQNVKVDFEEKRQTMKKHAKLPSRQRARLSKQYLVWLSFYLLPKVEVILY